MYKEITFGGFCDEFHSMGRGDSFTYKGLRALFDYLEDTNSETELDVIALCCEWDEYATALEAAQEYGHEPDPDDSEDEAEDRARDWLNDQTAVIEFDGGVLVAAF